MSYNQNKYELRENALVLGVFFIAVHVVYGKTWEAGFVTDFTGLLERLDGAPFKDFLHCFGFPALHQVTNFFLVIFYKLFGTAAAPWYFIYTSLHVVNGWLGYRLAKKILVLAGPSFQQVQTPVAAFKWSGQALDSVFFSAFIVALLFLLSPYNAEVVIWKVCFNFLFCTNMLLSSFLLLINYFEKGKKKDLLFSYSFFTVALFTFELSLAFPMMVVFFLFFGKKLVSEKYINPWSVAPFFILSVFYFFLNKIFIGSWVGHYGEGVHLNFDVKNIASNLLKYFSKNLLYWREWEHGRKELWMSFCEHPITAYSFVILCMTLFATGIIFYKKIKLGIRLTGLSWGLFFLALIPVANLYVVWLLHGENDRYGYFASLFFYIGLVALFQSFNNWIRYFFYAFFLTVSIFNLNKINTYWQESTTVVQGLLNDFRWEESSEIYVLAFPENYKGIPMFKDFSRQDLALKSALKYLVDKPVKGQFFQVAQFNMNTPSDGFNVEVDAAGIIKLEFYEWGSWWWRNGLGTGPYEREQYNFSTLPKGCEIKIKEVAADAVFIYSDGKKWKEVFVPD